MTRKVSALDLFISFSNSRRAGNAHVYPKVQQNNMLGITHLHLMFMIMYSEIKENITKENEIFVLINDSYILCKSCRVASDCACVQCRKLSNIPASLRTPLVGRETPKAQHCFEQHKTRL
mmetsp:Transcript_34041/g.47415  ORF Transcript_34041/g.47415 Transcript_34041/m.47415 type:complete len:120 (+) Transcript_34041:209-568(+)